MTAYEKCRLGATICLAVAAAALIALAVLIFTLPEGGAVVSNVEEVTTDKPSTEAVAPADEGYILREHEQIIGIFDSEGRLCGTVNLPTVTLPKSERDRLANGIKVGSQEELELLIESYS